MISLGSTEATASPSIFSFPSPADAEPPRGIPCGKTERDRAREGRKRACASMSGRTTRLTSKETAEAADKASAQRETLFKKESTLRTGPAAFGGKGITDQDQSVP